MARHHKKKPRAGAGAPTRAVGQQPFHDSTTDNLATFLENGEESAARKEKERLETHSLLTPDHIRALREHPRLGRRARLLVDKWLESTTVYTAEVIGECWLPLVIKNRHGVAQRTILRRLRCNISKDSYFSTIAHQSVAPWAESLERVARVVACVVCRFIPDANPAWTEGRVQFELLGHDGTPETDIDLKNTDRSFELAATISLISRAFSQHLARGSVATGYVKDDGGVAAVGVVGSRDLKLTAVSESRLMTHAYLAQEDFDFARLMHLKAKPFAIDEAERILGVIAVQPNRFVGLTRLSWFHQIASHVAAHLPLPRTLRDRYEDDLHGASSFLGRRLGAALGFSAACLALLALRLAALRGGDVTFQAGTAFGGMAIAYTAVTVLATWYLFQSSRGKALLDHLAAREIYQRGVAPRKLEFSGDVRFLISGIAQILGIMFELVTGGAVFALLVGIRDELAAHVVALAPSGVAAVTGTTTLVALPAGLSVYFLRQASRNLSNSWYLLDASFLGRIAPAGLATMFASLVLVWGYPSRWVSEVILVNCPVIVLVAKVRWRRAVVISDTLPWLRVSAATFVERLVLVAIGALGLTCMFLRAHEFAGAFSGRPVIGTGADEATLGSFVMMGVLTCGVFLSVPITVEWVKTYLEFAPRLVSDGGAPKNADVSEGETSSEVRVDKKGTVIGALRK